jgi:hypothetical protein
MVLEQTLSRAGNLDLTFIKAYSTGWEPAHNAHEPKQGTDSLILHEGTNFSQFIHKKTSETLFFQHFWQNTSSVAVLINPNVMQNPISHKIYAVRSFSKHSLALSIFLNNYSLLYLVNDEHLLMPESFRPIYNKYVKAETTLFSVKSHKTRIIKNIIKNLNGSTFNLILHNVAMVDNFHCNIMSENRLAKTEVWFCGFNATLRTGNLQKNRIICQLEKQHNLCFLQYIQNSSYFSDVPIHVPINAGYIIMMAQINERKLQPSR